MIVIYIMGLFCYNSLLIISTSLIAVVCLRSVCIQNHLVVE